MNKDERKKHFEEIYNRRLWGQHGNTLSGRGSSEAFTHNDSKFISKIISDKKVQSIVDICGDFAWQHKFLKNYKGEYLGVDISESCLNRISKSNQLSNVNFKQLDICHDDIPCSDLFICRDVLFHLSHDDILKFFNLLKKSKTEWVIVTSFNHSDQDYKSKQANACQHNLNLEPYNLIFEDKFFGYENIKGYEKKFLGLISVSNI